MGGCVQPIRVGHPQPRLEATFETEIILQAGADDASHSQPFSFKQAIEHRRSRVDARDLPVPCKVLHPFLRELPALRNQRQIEQVPPVLQLFAISCFVLFGARAQLRRAFALRAIFRIRRVLTKSGQQACRVGGIEIAAFEQSKSGGDRSNLLPPPILFGCMN